MTIILTRHATRATRTLDGPQLHVGRARSRHGRAQLLGALHLATDAQARLALVDFPAVAVLRGKGAKNAHGHHSITD